MIETELIVLFSQVIFATIAAFFAIFLLAYTREPGWIAVISGVVLEFVSVMFKVFKHFGILSPSDLLFESYPIAEILLEGFPSLCFSFGFILVLIARRKK